MKIKQNLLIFVVLLLLFGGCGKNMNETNVENASENITLTDRQKEILEKEGLPTNYSELSRRQQEDIIAIENMLQYVENKYGKSFSYSGYIEAGLEDEQLFAYPSDGYEGVDNFTITRAENGYTDDYINKASEELFSQYLCDAFSKKVNDNSIRVFSSVTKCELDYPIDAAKFDGNVEASAWVFVGGESSLTGESVVEAVNEYMTEHKLFGTIQIIVLNDNKLQLLTRHNYTDYLGNENYTFRKTIYVRR